MNNSRVATYLRELRYARREALQSNDFRVRALFEAVLRLVPGTLVLLREAR